MVFCVVSGLCKGSISGVNAKEERDDNKNKMMDSQNITPSLLEDTLREPLLSVTIHEEEGEEEHDTHHENDQGHTSSDHDNDPPIEPPQESGYWIDQGGLGWQWLSLGQSCSESLWGGAIWVLYLGSFQDDDDNDGTWSTTPAFVGGLQALQGGAMMVVWLLLTVSFGYGGSVSCHIGFGSSHSWLLVAWILMIATFVLQGLATMGIIVSWHATEAWMAFVLVWGMRRGVLGILTTTGSTNVATTSTEAAAVPTTTTTIPLVRTTKFSKLQSRHVLARTVGPVLTMVMFAWTGNHWTTSTLQAILYTGFGLEGGLHMTVMMRLWVLWWFRSWRLTPSATTPHDQDSRTGEEEEEESDANNVTHEWEPASPGNHDDSAAAANLFLFSPTDSGTTLTTLSHPRHWTTTMDTPSSLESPLSLHHHDDDNIQKMNLKTATSTRPTPSPLFSFSPTNPWPGGGGAQDDTNTDTGEEEEDKENQPCQPHTPKEDTTTKSATIDKPTIQWTEAMMQKLEEDHPRQLLFDLLAEEQWNRDASPSSSPQQQQRHHDDDGNPGFPDQDLLIVESQDTWDFQQSLQPTFHGKDRETTHPEHNNNTNNRAREGNNHPASSLVVSHTVTRPTRDRQACWQVTCHVLAHAASGLSALFLPLFLRNDCHLSPLHVQLVPVVSGALVLFCGQSSHARRRRPRWDRHRTRSWFQRQQPQQQSSSVIWMILVVSVVCGWVVALVDSDLWRRHSWAVLLLSILQSGLAQAAIQRLQSPHQPQQQHCDHESSVILSSSFSCGGAPHCFILRDSAWSCLALVGGYSMELWGYQTCLALSCTLTLMAVLLSHCPCGSTRRRNNYCCRPNDSLRITNDSLNTEEDV